MSVACGELEQDYSRVGREFLGESQTSVVRFRVQKVCLKIKISEKNWHVSVLFLYLSCSVSKSKTNFSAQLPLWKVNFYLWPIRYLKAFSQPALGNSENKLSLLLIEAGPAKSFHQLFQSIWDCKSPIFFFYALSDTHRLFHFLPSVSSPLLLPAVSSSSLLLQLVPFCLCFPAIK